MDLLALTASVSILLTVLAVVFAFASSAMAGAQVRGRLEGILAGTTSVVEGTPSDAPLRQSRSVLGLFSHILSGSWLERIGGDLQRADSKLQPVDFIAIRLALAGLGFAAPYLFVGGLLGLGAGAVAGILGFQLPQMWLSRKRESRNKKLEDQLPEALSLVSNSLKAGFGLLQSLNLASEQLEHPLSTELAQAIHEMNIGSSAEQALTDLSARSGSYDMDLVVTAILVQRSVGGNLAEILDTVADTMRERVRIRGEIVTLTAQQRLTGIVIGLLPVAVGGLFFLMSPDYIKVLFTESLGRILLGVALGMEFVGVMIIRRILAIEV